jgi:CHAD domain-containing protein
MAKSWKVDNLNTEKKFSVCAKKIVTTRIREMFSYEQTTREGIDIEAVHDMRVSARRLQTALKLSSGIFPQKKFRVYSSSVKSLLSVLGSVREKDVFIAMLEKYSSQIDTNERRALDWLLARQKALNISRRKQLIKQLDSLAQQNFRESFERFIEQS